MDESLAATLQAAVQAELARRFDLDDGTMAEYVVVMLQNGKNAPDITAELNDLVPNFDASFTEWVFRQVSRLQSGQSIESADKTQGVTSQTEDENMAETENIQESNEQGMGYPSSRLYSGLKKTLQENNTTDSGRNRHRPDLEGVRSSPYGSVAPANGAQKIPTGPRNSEYQQKGAGAGPIRTNHQRQERGGPRKPRHAGSDFPAMPQFPEFPMPPPEFFASLPLASRLGAIDGATPGTVRAPTRRCTKWPTCFKGKACTFAHPTTMCQNPSCRKIDGSCPSIHVNEDIDLMSGIDAQRKTDEELEAKAVARANKFKHKIQMNAIRSGTANSENDGTTPICKFGEACTNRACHFSHPSPASKNGSSIVLHSENCTQGMECKDEQCSYSHPSPSNQYTPGVKLNTAPAEIQCKFHPCLNPSCRFQHGPGQKTSTKPAFGIARNKVWTPNSGKAMTAERTYVAGEAEEQFTAASNVHDNDTEMEK